MKDFHLVLCSKAEKQDFHFIESSSSGKDDNHFLFAFYSPARAPLAVKQTALQFKQHDGICKC